MCIRDSIVALYNSRIYDQAEGSEDIAGTILALWHDRLIDNEWNLVIENGLYPNMLAIAERAWRGGGTEYFDGLGTILPPEDTEAFKEFADFEKRMLWHKAHTFKGYPFALSLIHISNTSFVKNMVEKLPFNGNVNNRQGGEQVWAPKSNSLVWVGSIQEGKSLGDIIAYKQVRILRDWDCLLYTSIEFVQYIQYFSEYTGLFYQRDVAGLEYFIEPYLSVQA